MITLITLLISLLGYGMPSDFSHLSEAELQNEIELAQSEQSAADGGVLGSWEQE